MPLIFNQKELRSHIDQIEINNVQVTSDTYNHEFISTQKFIYLLDNMVTSIRIADITGNKGTIDVYFNNKKRVFFEFDIAKSLTGTQK